MSGCMITTKSKINGFFKKIYILHSACCSVLRLKIISKNIDFWLWVKHCNYTLNGTFFRISAHTVWWKNSLMMLLVTFKSMEKKVTFLITAKSCCPRPENSLRKRRGSGLYVSEHHTAPFSYYFSIPSWDPRKTLLHPPNEAISMLLQSVLYLINVKAKLSKYPLYI